MTAVEVERAWSAPEAARVAGISYRQVDYWDRLGLVSASVAPGEGSGSRRLYSFDDVVRLAVMAALVAGGVALPIAGRIAARASHMTKVRARRGPHVALVVDVAAIRDGVNGAGAPRST